MPNSKPLITIGIPILAMLLSFIGALGGSYLSAQYSESLWEKSEQAATFKMMLNKKVELIESVSKVANSANEFKAYQAYLTYQAKLAKNFDKCSAKEKCTKPDSFKDVLSVSVKRADLNSKYSSTLQLVALYFGDSVDEPLFKLSENLIWWEDSAEDFKKLISAMSLELVNEA